MKIALCLLLLIVVCSPIHAQLRFSNYALTDYSGNNAFSARKLYQRNSGAIVGIQRGNITSIEFGGEMHWRKMAFRKPTITGVTANLEYNFGHHVLGYKAGIWQKKGRVNLTYGGNLVYFTNFNGLQRYGLGPAVGFRFAGFHLVNGFNLLLGDKEFKDVNKLYIALRYYFPVDNKFTWDRETMRKKRERRNEREDRREQRAKDREEGKRWNWRKPLDIFKKQD
jgi:hypothetical protein